MKTTEEVFSHMLDAIAEALATRTPRIVYGTDYETLEAEERRREADRRALFLVREFFVPIIADVARHAVT